MKVVNIGRKYTYVDIEIEDFVSPIELIRITEQNGEIKWKNQFLANYNKEDSEKLEAAYQQYLSEKMKTELTTEALLKTK
jgi:hypothetical protein